MYGYPTGPVTVEGYCWTCGNYAVLDKQSKMCEPCMIGWTATHEEVYGVPYAKGLDIDMTTIE